MTVGVTGLGGVVAGSAVRPDRPIQPPARSPGGHRREPQSTLNISHAS